MSIKLKIAIIIILYAKHMELTKNQKNALQGILKAYKDVLIFWHNKKPNT